MNNEKPPIQQKMFTDLADSILFEKVREYGCRYLEEVFERPVVPTPEAIRNLSVFEEKMPEESADTAEIIDLLQKYGAPATVAQVAGRYFGFVNGSVVPAGLLAKNLSVFWDQNAAMQVMSPLVSRLECIVQDWLKQIFELPPQTVTGFVSGTSMANFCGLAAARYRLLHNQGWDVTASGLFGAPLVRVVAGEEAHSSVLKAVSLIGFGRDNIEWVPADDQGRIQADQIPELDNRTLLILQAGNVNSGAFDHFEKICKKARSQGAWIHIDGAFGLWAAGSERLKKLTRGMEYAHSWAVDGHKTLNTPYDSGIVLCADEDALVASLHTSGAYLITGKDRDGMFYTPEMSRRSRIIELWATLKFLGKSGLDEMIYGMHQHARLFAERLNEENGFTVLNDVVFNQVVVACATDEITESVLLNVQKSGVCWVGGSKWSGKKVIRISVCSWSTTEADVNRSVKTFKRALINC